MLLTVLHACYHPRVLCALQLILCAGKLATLKGTVTRMSHVRPLIVDMTFTCNKCGNEVTASMPDGRFTPPTCCTGTRYLVVLAGSTSWLQHMT